MPNDEQCTWVSCQMQFFSSWSIKNIITTNSEKFIADAKAKVTVSYGDNSNKTDNKTVLTGASCNVTTDCGNKICKTTCTGAIEVDFAYSTHTL